MSSPLSHDIHDSYNNQDLVAEMVDHITEVTPIVQQQTTATGTPCPSPDSPITTCSTSLPLVSQQRNLLTGGVPLSHHTTAGQEQLRSSIITDPTQNVVQPLSHISPPSHQLPPPPLLQPQQLYQKQQVPPLLYLANQQPLVHPNNGSGRSNSPTYSDISSILLPPPPSSQNEPFIKPPFHHPHKRSHPHTLPPLSGVSSSTDSLSDEGGAGHLITAGTVHQHNMLSPTSVIIGAGGIKKRAFSNSPLSDMTTDLNSLIRSSPNSLLYNPSQTIGATNIFSFPPPSQGAMGHLVHPPQPPPPPPPSQLQYTIKEQKMSIERNQNFTNGTFDTTITNRVTYSEKPPPLLPSIPPQTHLLHGCVVNSMVSGGGQEAMEVGLPSGGTIHSPSSNHTECTDVSSEEPVTCQWSNCSQQLSTISELVHHIEKTHIEKSMMEDYVCLWKNCPRRRKPFNARYKLVIHMRIHSGEKPNKCSHPGCPKAFSRLENLKIHMRTHTGEKPYTCQFNGCDKSFSNSSDRSKHQKTHFEQKPYACTFPGCDKRYTDPSSLRKHSRTHSQKKSPPLTDCLHIHSLNSIQSPLNDNRKLNKKKELIVIPKQEHPPPPSLIHFPPPPIDPYYTTPPSYYQTQQAPPLPVYSMVSPYDHTHYYHPPPVSPTKPLPPISTHTQLQVSVNGYGQLYEEPHPLTHYPDHPPPRYEDSFYSTKPLLHPSHDTITTVSTGSNNSSNTLYSTNYYM